MFHHTFDGCLFQGDPGPSERTVRAACQVDQGVMQVT
jgi:hypothetical protein